MLKKRKYIWTVVILMAGLSAFLLILYEKKDRLEQSSYELEGAFPNLTFVQPVDLQHSPDGTDRLFVVEQQGMIHAFLNAPETKEMHVFLDIRDEVFMGDSEEGLLGLAFHPRYKENGYFYVDYVANNPRRTVIARFQRSPDDSDKADRSSKLVILEVEQPYSNHNGGQIVFGPDGCLYIALGDGGSGGDPHNHGQDVSTLLGSILRIDVDHPSPGKKYSVPPDNPFSGHHVGAAEEIYAYGLRNPWRFSFDPVTGRLWAADVGQDKPIEEIDIIEEGKNYGWNIMEGSSCFKPPLGCNKKGLTLPIWEYTRDKGRCITGGFVYRGSRLPELAGSYIYGDFISGRLWKLTYDGRHPAVNELLLHNPDLYPSSFGVDENQELYICSFDGRIYRLKEAKD